MIHQKIQENKIELHLLKLLLTLGHIQKYPGPGTQFLQAL